ncbi:hypothetical protein GYA13_00485 [Candidatus Kuenenbacteria bacterium]|nr:hypothetical protein [Candidatus Kuenenbacteria bacterium]
MLGGNWLQCLAAGIITSVSDVAAFVQVVIDSLKRKELFSRQSKIMIAAKEISHSHFLWVLAIVVLVTLYPMEYGVFVLPSALLVLTLILAAILKNASAVIRQLVSWVLLLMATLFAFFIGIALHEYPYTMWPASITLMLLLHWIMDGLTHSWGISDARRSLDLSKEEADVSMTWPLGFWVDCGIYDYRPEENTLLWKILPKKKLEVAVFAAAIAITAIKIL